MTTPSQPGTSSTGGILGGTPAVGPTSSPVPLNNQRVNATFPTLNPPQMKTLVYAPDVTILIGHNGIQYDISKDIARGQVVRKENSASSLFVTLANPQLRYNNTFSRMDRISCYLTRTQKLQVFSGYLDTIPYMQAYPGTVDLRATCTLKRLLHTWWNPALAASQQFFDQLGPNLGTGGDGQGGGVTDSGIGDILKTILTQVGRWPAQSVHVQNFPQEFITFLNNYMTTNAATNPAHNTQLAQQYSALLLGDDLSPGPMGAVGYSAGDPLGTAASATNDAPTFFVSQIVTAVDQRGMGPVVNQAANSQAVQQTADVLESASGTGGLTNQELATDVHEAGQQLSQYASNWSTQNSASDAAILAVACATVESGMQMLANNADPPSLTFWHTGLSTTGTNDGLFGQSNNGQWGTAAQRMNPLSSAGMFLDALNSKTGWRNMDGGQAIWQVTQSASSNIPLYSAAITAATELVSAYRQASTQSAQAASNALGNVPGVGSAANVLGGGTNPISSAAGMAITTATTSPISTAAGVVTAGRPNPDSEGAINAAYTLVGTPYVYGGNTPGVGIDCSRFVELSFIAGTGIDVTRSTDSQRSFIRPVPLSSIQRGDVLQTNGGGHTGIYLGAGTWIQTGDSRGIVVEPVPQGGGGLMWAGRVCGNGGVGPAPFSPITGATGALGVGAPGTGVAPGQGSGGGGTASEPIARNLFSYIFTPATYASAFADFLTGEKAFIDDQPLIQIVRALSSASLRNFQSAPNGDFMAYYPDPFGMDGKPAILALEDIELKDCHIDLSDNNMATHVYIEGDYTMIGQADQSVGWLTTSGVATVQNPWLFQRLIQAAPGDIDSTMTAEALMNRFGVRPYKDSYQIAGNAGLEFLLACQIFMGKWAAQYETDIGLTFMPELYPGMRVLLVGHNLQVYVSAVTHEFDWQRGFTTSATVSAASNPSAASNIYASLPGFLNPVSTILGNNTSNTGQQVTPSFQALLAGGPANFQAGTFPGAAAFGGLAGG